MPFLKKEPFPLRYLTFRNESKSDYPREYVYHIGRNILLRSRKSSRSHVLTMLWSNKFKPFNQIMGTITDAKHQIKTYSTSNENFQTSSSDFKGKKAKSMSDSYCEVHLPFKDNPSLLEDYASYFGGIRVGKIFEDLDAFAAFIAYQHCSGSEKDILDRIIVTAAIEKIEMLKSLSIKENARMTGCVTFTGTSSMEVTIRVESQDLSGMWNLTFLAKFIMVSRSINGKESISIPEVLPENDEERKIINEGLDSYQRRQNEKQYINQINTMPSAKEFSEIYELFCSRKRANMEENFESKKIQIPIKDTRQQSIRICHPQERNIHNYIFGGFIMKEAYEIAHSTVLIYTGSRPTFVSVDEIIFMSPVPIGSILQFDSRIVFNCLESNIQYSQVAVDASVLEVPGNIRKKTNSILITFSHPDCKKSVTPETFFEAMEYLRGKRSRKITED